MNFQPYYDFLLQTARQAGQICMNFYQAGIQAEYKQDGSPVTAADRAVEEFIRSEIQRRYPEHSILGEERGQAQGRETTHCWIIDPIDGTKSFLRGVPLFAVLIGLEIEGEIRAGAAYFPALDEMLSAADGLGCWWNGRRAHVSGVDSLEKAYICYTNLRGMQKHGRGNVFSALNEVAFAMRGWSDAYGYLLAATGRVEAMLDPVMNIWDCAPFPVIFREAGGFFSDWQGNPGHTHGEALACNRVLLDTILELIANNPG